MPVVVTGADEPLGGAVVEALLALGDYEVRATVDHATRVAPLVARGVKTAVADFRELVRFGAVLEGAHTVIHVRGGMSAVVTLSGDGGIDDVLSAAEETGVRRIITLAPATTTAAEETALGRLRASDYDSVVFRVGETWDHTTLAAAIVTADESRDVRGHLDVDVTDGDPLVALRAAVETRRSAG